MRKKVVPLVGTWIETVVILMLSIILAVVPLVGTWIETAVNAVDKTISTSCPSWARGLKHFYILGCLIAYGRAPRGHVD
mgnify:CR=1 FL=1